MEKYLDEPTPMRYPSLMAQMIDYTAEVVEHFLVLHPWCHSDHRVTVSGMADKDCWLCGAVELRRVRYECDDFGMSMSRLICLTDECPGERHYWGGL